jgi:hypothetical protein
MFALQVGSAASLIQPRKVSWLMRYCGCRADFHIVRVKHVGREAEDVGHYP